MTDVWRVIDTTGKEHVAPTPGALFPWPSCASWAQNNGIDTAQIIPPGQLTASELVTAERERCARIVDRFGMEVKENEEMIEGARWLVHRYKAEVLKKIRSGEP